MPFLIVPPTQFITENPEHSTELKATAGAYQSKLLLELQPGTLEKTIEIGAFKGTRIFKWTENYSAVLDTRFLMPWGKNQFDPNPIKVASLVTTDECIHLGSSWDFPPSALLSKPEGIPVSSTNFLQVKKRISESKTTLRLDTQIAGNFSQRGVTLFDAVMSESFASRGWPINSSLSRLACEWAVFAAPSNRPVDDVTKKRSYPSRAHRILLTKLEPTEPTSLKWPQVSGSMTMNSGIFGEKTQLVKKIEKLPFSAFGTEAEAFQKIENSVHDLKQEKFKVTKRLGRWIYLNRGRAYGLTIGTHLSSSKGSTLHVIQFVPSEISSEPDVAVALIRDESPENRIAVGDQISFDLTEFPKAR